MTKKKSLTMHEQGGYYIGAGPGKASSSCPPPTQQGSCVKDPVYGCILWQGKLDRTGYGRISGQLAHRWFWSQARGPLPPEKPELDHLCQRRNCVNLDHLEPVSRRENERRKQWRRRAVVGFSVNDLCPNGHEMSLYGMPTPERGKVCRKCVKHVW